MKNGRFSWHEWSERFLLFFRSCLSWTVWLQNSPVTAMCFKSILLQIKFRVHGQIALGLLVFSKIKRFLVDSEESKFEIARDVLLSRRFRSWIILTLIRFLLLVRTVVEKSVCGIIFRRETFSGDFARLLVCGSYGWLTEGILAEHVRSSRRRNKWRK